ncbi:uncharacterized protein LOC135473132 [Liolophura sinensis]|uniref:uncharacterized protein LOC135473132 n=1 Tax=Liolophura sinensis TaxID=3198878 RepID=UPI0031593BFB
MALKMGSATRAKQSVSKDEAQQEGHDKEKRQLLLKRFEKVLQNTKGVKLGDEAVKRLLLENGTDDLSNRKSTTTNKKKRGRKLLVAAAVVPLLLLLALLLDVELSPSGVMKEFKETPCLVDNNAIVMEISRPLVECGACSNLRQVPVETNLTTKDFIEKYAYSGVPVLVKGATTTWSAMSVFSYQYFKELYQSRENALDDVEEDCQFFPYKTEFATLKEVFDMDEDRANLKQGQPNWYIGWSNCHPDTGAELRKHYSKPYFLPEDSETSVIDWMFMGGSGEGANLHLDYVQRPSWQAQISGRKSWALVPAPECESVCHSLNVTVEKGDIIVVDTNTWYHSTFVHPGEISITIGSEYD